MDGAGRVPAWLREDLQDARPLIPKDMFIVIPSRLSVGEPFAIKVKLRGEVREIPCAGAWNTKKPRLRGPFNRNVQRGIRFMDDCLPEWRGALRVVGGGALDGPERIVFDGVSQGAFPGDTRPIGRFGGFRWTEPGFRFLRLIEPESGLEALSNPASVTPGPPAERLYWGDPHWQTFFSDGVRCPEELYAFARDEGFLDFGAVADHMEAVTDRQWDYFQAVANDFNEPGRFATLVGQEWTNHDQASGAPGHRNIYYRGDGGPVLRSDDPACNTLEKLWRRLDALEGIEALAVPHHSANAVMGVDWSQGWNPRYERAVEVYSVWGSSERPAGAGNPRPIHPANLGGERAGRHVVDALKRGYRLGFVGGGDIHDGRPGDDLHEAAYPARAYPIHPQGFAAAFAPRLTREDIFDAIAGRRTYAATKSRIYLDVTPAAADRLRIRAASEEGIAEVALVRNGEDAARFGPDEDPRIVQTEAAPEPLGPEEFCYVRVLTEGGEMAWSSPLWRDDMAGGRH